MDGMRFSIDGRAAAVSIAAAGSCLCSFAFLCSPVSSFLVAVVSKRLKSPYRFGTQKL